MDYPFFVRGGWCFLKVSYSYYDLVAELQKRRRILGIPQILLDDIAGFQDGYTGKLEKPMTSYGRHAGWNMLEIWLQALGVGIAVVPAPSRHLARIRKPSVGTQLELEFSQPAPYPDIKAKKEEEKKRDRYKRKGRPFRFCVPGDDEEEDTLH